MSAAHQVEVEPPWPFRLPGHGGGDGVMRVERGVVSRLLLVDGSPVLARAWEMAGGRVGFRAEPLDPAALSVPRSLPPQPAPPRPAGREQLERAVERLRFALGVDDDFGEFYARFRGDRLLGPLIRRRPQMRVRRRPWPWEALAWAVVRQLIESDRAARIQRRIVGRWGVRGGRHRGALRDVPAPAVIAGRAPAELAAMDLSPARCLALRRVAAEVAAGRCDPAAAAGDARLLAIPEIGPWTVSCLGLLGRGEADALPAGDLVYLKLVGRLARLGRRATVEEVEEFFGPYEPYRGLAAAWAAGAYG